MKLINISLIVVGVAFLILSATTLNLSITSIDSLPKTKAFTITRGAVVSNLVQGWLTTAKSEGVDMGTASNQVSVQMGSFIANDIVTVANLTSTDMTDTTKGYFWAKPANFVIQGNSITFNMQVWKYDLTYAGGWFNTGSGSSYTYPFWNGAYMTVDYKVSDTSFYKDTLQILALNIAGDIERTMGYATSTQTSQTFPTPTTSTTTTHTTTTTVTPPPTTTPNPTTITGTTTITATTTYTRTVTIQINNNPLGLNPTESAVSAIAGVGMVITGVARERKIKPV